MSQPPLVKIAAATAAEVCATFMLSPEAGKLLQNGMTPAAFVDALLGKNLCVPAVDFMAHALPLREGIWWGCLCMQHTYGSALTAEERSAAVAAVRWVFQPVEENQAAAKAGAEAAGPATPAGALAMAIVLKGPSGTKAVANAVKLASLKVDALQVAAVQKRFVELGMEIAEGRYL